MATIGGAVSEVAGSIRAVVGLSRPGRLRDQIAQTLDLYAKAADHEQLAEVRTHLANALEHQTEALAKVVHPDSKRSFNWGPFAVAIVFFVIPTLALTWWGFQYTDRWWGWIWFVLAAMLSLVLVFASFYALLSQEDD